MLNRTAAALGRGSVALKARLQHDAHPPKAANAAMKSIVRRDTGESYNEFLANLAQASGIETPTTEELLAFDRRRKDKKTSNDDWHNPSDPDAKIAKMKDGRTHLAHKNEHVVDLETGAILAAEIHAADQGDTTTMMATLESAAHSLHARDEQVRMVLDRVERLVDLGLEGRLIGEQGEQTLGALVEGRLAQAEAKFRLALALLDGADQSASIDPAPILNNLAALYKEQGFYVYAEPLYRQALSLRRARFGRDVDRTVTVRVDQFHQHHPRPFEVIADRHQQDAFAYRSHAAPGRLRAGQGPLPSQPEGGHRGGAGRARIDR